MYEGDVADLKVEEGKAIGFLAYPIDMILNANEETKKKFIPVIFSPEILMIFERLKTLIERGE